MDPQNLKYDETNDNVEFSDLQSRLIEVDRVNDNNLLALDKKYLIKIGEIKSEIDVLLNEYVSGNCQDLEKEKASLKRTVDLLEEKISSIQSDQKLYEEEKQKLKSNHEEEQNKALEMQNEMVNDLEKLILAMESEKSKLENSIENLKNSNEDLTGQLSDFEKRIFILDNRIICVDREKNNLKDENVKLRSIIEEESENVSDLNGSKSLKMMDELISQVRELQVKLDESQSSLENQEKLYSEKLEKVKEEYDKKVSSLRQDMSEEIDILEQNKDDVENDLEGKISKLKSDYEEQIYTCQQQSESRLSEEKAEFGRVLVTKIDEYEKKLSEKIDEISGYQVRLDSLQKDYEDKLTTIGELETNLADLSYIRLGLEKEVRELKSTVNQLKKVDPSNENHLKDVRNQFEERANRLQPEASFRQTDHEGHSKKSFGNLPRPSTPEMTYWPNPTSPIPGIVISGRNTPTSSLSRSSSNSSFKGPSSPPSVRRKT